MRFRRLDLNLLVALDALLTEMSISRAAEKLSVTQSTMSHSLARLREHFRDDLLVQVGRKMELTPRALSLQEPIRDVLVRVSTTIDYEPEFDAARSDRTFVLHVSDYTMELLFPHVLALAEAKGSRVRFALQPQFGSPARALERGEVDLMLIPATFCSPDHPTEPIFQEQLVALMWSGSRLAEVELTAERFAHARHVAMTPVGAAQPAFESWMEQHGIRRHLEVSTYSFTAIPSMLVGTELIATVHSRLALAAAACMPLKVVPLPLQTPPLMVAMQWHRHRTQDPALVWLRALMQEAAARMTPIAAPPPWASAG